MGVRLIRSVLSRACGRRVFLSSERNGEDGLGGRLNEVEGMLRFRGRERRLG